LRSEPDESRATPTTPSTAHGGSSSRVRGDTATEKKTVSMTPLRAVSGHSAAAMMAFLILAYVPQRHRLVTEASISASVGFGICASNAAAAIRNPGWQ